MVVEELSDRLELFFLLLGFVWQDGPRIQIEPLAHAPFKVPSSSCWVKRGCFLFISQVPSCVLAHEKHQTNRNHYSTSLWHEVQKKTAWPFTLWCLQKSNFVKDPPLKLAQCHDFRFHKMGLRRLCFILQETSVKMFAPGPRSSRFYIKWLLWNLEKGLTMFNL